MSTEQVTSTLDDGVLTLTLNRPDKLNAYTAQMGRELAAAFRRADADDAVRVVVVTGAGKHFCAGADISGGADSFGGNPATDLFDATEAQRGGLVESVEAPADLLPKAMAIAREIADHTAPVATALTRQLLWRFTAEPTPFGLLELDGAMNIHRGAGADVHEGVSAFLEKRAPAFPGKVSTDLPPQYPWWAPARSLPP